MLLGGNQDIGNKIVRSYWKQSKHGKCISKVQTDKARKENKLPKYASRMSYLSQKEPNGYYVQLQKKMHTSIQQMGPLENVHLCGEMK